MDANKKSTNLRKSNTGAYMALLLLQLVVFAATGVAWWWLIFEGSGRCGQDCDSNGETLASLIFVSTSALSFLFTILATIVNRITSKDLLWVPIVSCALIVVGYFSSAAVYNVATGG
jgi:hypothetical protein